MLDRFENLAIYRCARGHSVSARTLPNRPIEQTAQCPQCVTMNELRERREQPVFDPVATFLCMRRTKAPRRDF